MKATLLLPLLSLLAPALRAEITFEPWSMTVTSLFPSAIISSATVDWNGDEQMAEDKKTQDDPELEEDEVPLYGDENGWLAARILDVPAGAKLKVELSIEGYMKPSTWTGTIKEAAEEIRVFPKAIWDYDALHKVKQQRPVNLIVKLTVNGKELAPETETCIIKSINDCPFCIVWDEEEEDYEDFSELFAAYVNENHPVVDAVLKEALTSKLVTGFTGYQSEDSEEVMAQVFAVWNALQRRGIKYSDISTTTPDDLVYSQTVRFLDESINSSQANCVDGSVLMASILRKIGLNPHLVMVPGHCFLAFETAPIDWEAEVPLRKLIKTGMLVGLETTMLGDNDLKAAKELAKMPAAAKKKEFNASYATFTSALETGTASLMEHLKEFEDEEAESQLISVEDARNLGIMPLASEVKKE
jgi:hypothetical protein